MLKKAIGLMMTIMDNITVILIIIITILVVVVVI